MFIIYKIFANYVLLFSSANGTALLSKHAAQRHTHALFFCVCNLCVDLISTRENTQFTSTASMSRPPSIVFAGDPRAIIDRASVCCIVYVQRAIAIYSNIVWRFGESRSTRTDVHCGVTTMCEKCARGVSGGCLLLLLRVHRECRRLARSRGLVRVCICVCDVDRLLRALATRRPRSGSARG